MFTGPAGPVELPVRGTSTIFILLPNSAAFFETFFTDVFLRDKRRKNYAAAHRCVALPGKPRPLLRRMVAPHSPNSSGTSQLRVAIIGQSGPYAPTALHSLCLSPQPFTVVGVVMGQRRMPGRAPHKLHPPPLSGRQKLSTQLPTDSLLEVAAALGSPVLQTCAVNHPAACRQIAAWHADVLVCIGYYELFGPTLLGCAKLCLNAHPSRLPALRGPAPLFWAIRQGLQETCVSVHVMDAEADHGPIVAQQRLLIAPRTDGQMLYRAAARLAAAQLSPLLQRLALAGPTAQALPQLLGHTQDHSLCTWAPRPRPEDVRVHPAQWGVEGLLNFACAAPYFRAPCLMLGGQPYFVSAGLRGDLGAKLPGEYVLHHDTLAVQCKDGIAYLQVQI
jgi:methionyl-tRNA formyltransferase